MTQAFQNRLRMKRATLTELAALKPLWESDPMMQREVRRLEENTAEIRACHARTLAAPGKEQRKASGALRTEAIDAVMVLVNVTRTWAEEAPEAAVLRERVSVSRSTLRGTVEAELLPRLQELLVLCQDARPGIMDNPLTTEDYQRAETCIAAFQRVENDARKSDVGRQAENDNLKSLFKHGTYILGRIDRLMAKYRKSHPLEHARYLAARTIIDYGTGRKPKAKANDKKTPDSKSAAAKTPDKKPVALAMVKPDETAQSGEPDAAQEPDADTPTE